MGRYPLDSKCSKLLSVKEKKLLFVRGKIVKETTNIKKNLQIS